MEAQASWRAQAWREARFPQAPEVASWRLPARAAASVTFWRERWLSSHVA